MFYHGTIDLSGNYAMVVQYQSSSKPISYEIGQKVVRQDMTKHDTVILLLGSIKLSEDVLQIFLTRSLIANYVRLSVDNRLQVLQCHLHQTFRTIFRE